MFHLRILGLEGTGFNVNTRKVIGRLPGPDSAVQLRGVTVSKQHCTVEDVGGRYILVRDLGSLNGTLVNGRKIQGEAKAYPGSQIQIGEFVLQVERHASEDVTAETPVRTGFRPVAFRNEPAPVSQRH